MIAVSTRICTALVFAAAIMFSSGSRADDTKYYGFTLIDCTANNYVIATAPFTNIGHMCAYDPSDYIVARLSLMAANNMLAILSVQGIFFDGATLRRDYQSRWDRFIAVNKLDAYLAKLAAFYVADEPFWNGVKYADLKTVSDTIKKRFPGVATMFIEAYPMLSVMQVPASIDVIGFDRYAVLDPYRDNSYRTQLESLKNKRSGPHQKIILVMDAQWLPFYAEGGNTEAAMAQVATSYYSLAGSDPDIIALIGYTWEGGLDGADQKGAKDLPASVITEYKRIGKLLTKKGGVL